MPRTNPPSPALTLRRLTACCRTFGEGASERKRDLLELLEHGRLGTAAEVLALHDQLCFLRAYPDDRALLDVVERLLADFEQRADLARTRDELADSGVAGTRIRYRFYWPVARWLAEHWPESLRLVWDDPAAAERLSGALPQLVTPPETEAARRLERPAHERLDHFLAPFETDAGFLVQRIGALPGDGFTREALHDGLDQEYALEPGPTTPARTRARHAASPVVFRDTELVRARPDLERELRRPPRAVRRASTREGRQLIDLALHSMVTRSRDLEAFGYGDPRDVRVIDDGAGLEFACIGVLPERRRLLHATYGILTLQSGVPVGYVQLDVLFGSVGLSFNTFKAFRGGEAARIFGRLLAATRHLFGVRSFSIEPYQLGEHNAEAIDSGAWWFYYKLGFRPQDADVERLGAQELRKLARDPRHRSTKATLRKLAAQPLFRTAGRKQPVPAPPWDLGLVVARELAARGGADRAGAVQVALEEARDLLGLRALRGWTKDERTALERWSPLVLALPGIERWSRAEHAALVAVVRAKGGREESAFQRLFDAHAKLVRATLRLAARESS